MFTSIANFVRDNFKGMLVFADVHGDYVSFMKAREFAQAEGYFFMSLGDLVDRGPSPYEVVTSMHKFMQEKTAGFTVGNHDNKFFRYFKTGPAHSKVRFSRDGQATLASVGEDRMFVFLNSYAEVCSDAELAAVYHKFGDLILVHAASHPAMWEQTEKFGKTAESRALVGETNGEIGEDGYPIRLYNWIEEIPMGKTVLVGHDKMPIHGVNITEPMVVPNKNGGKAVFLDTGCGKGGFLSGAVVVPSGNGFKIDKFVEFK